MVVYRHIMANWYKCLKNIDCVDNKPYNAIRINSDNIPGGNNEQV